LGQPLTKASLIFKCQVEIISVFAGPGSPGRRCVLPGTDIIEGTIQIAVIEGRVGKVTVQNDVTIGFRRLMRGYGACGQGTWSFRIA